MASRYRWRQQLLGSLQGQLHLATYLVVFLGITGASSVGLLVSKRNLLANDQPLARKSKASRSATKPSVACKTTPSSSNQPPAPSFSFNTAMKASWGTSTLPMAFIRFLPLACFFSSFFFREMSPP